ncbi:unnamed protein product [Phytophthora fragariaefolia]|uniref:Unnamed protein product n=1 Tax=Phytophthora fragariaefolia TaxID=1490495 RepID=A0A9W6YBJ4_9STRA|nr:unnamed protein product [Phytophthora fragariaefolia]
MASILIVCQLHPGVATLTHVVHCISTFLDHPSRLDASAGLSNWLYKIAGLRCRRHEDLPIAKYVFNCQQQFTMGFTNAAIRGYVFGTSADTAIFAYPMAGAGRTGDATSALLDLAAQNGNLAVVNELHENGREQASMTTCSAAGGYGRSLKRAEMNDQCLAAQ